MNLDRPRYPARVGIVGAGVSGLGMAVKLKRAGVPFTVFEKAGEIGGTWRENTYPGLVCDVPAVVYTYAYESNAEMPNYLATGAEIQRYLMRLCDKHLGREHIRFGTEVVEARWADGRWRVHTASGDEQEFEVLVHATGFLHHPRLPEIEGRESFTGPAFHSAEWDHDIAIAGKRVGVIGTGSTGVQIVTALAGTARRLCHFQRTPQWILPLGNPELPAVMRRALGRWPALSRLWIEAQVRLLGDCFVSPAALRPGWQRRMFGRMVRRNLETLRDPELRARLTPTYRPLCKRPVMSKGFYEAVQRPDVEVVTGGIERIVPEGVVSADGLHELDVLVFATGFHAHSYMLPMQVVGKDGVTLEQAWQGGPSAYRTIALPGFPNMFLLLGPHSPLINVPIHESVELQADYVLQALSVISNGAKRSISPTPQAAERWMREVRAAMPATVWGPGCDSWYIGADGVAVQWPFTRRRFRELLRSPDLRDYEVHPT